jgi:anti-sigma B factor antagonist
LPPGHCLSIHCSDIRFRCWTKYAEPGFADAAGTAESDYCFQTRTGRRETMLNIEKKRNASELTVALTGRLDTTTSPELEKALKASLDGVTDLVIDMAGLEYISSAGLRVMLTAQKTMNRQGSMRVIHVNDIIGEIFEVTGFTDILTIQ